MMFNDYQHQDQRITHQVVVFVLITLVQTLALTYSFISVP